MRKDTRRWYHINIFCKEEVFNAFDKGIKFSYYRGMSYKPKSSKVNVVTSSYTYKDILLEWLKNNSIKYDIEKLTYNELMRKDY